MSASERPPLGFPNAPARYPEAAAFFETAFFETLSRPAVGNHLGSAVRAQTRRPRLEQVIQTLTDGKPL